MVLNVNQLKQEKELLSQEFHIKRSLKRGKLFR